MAKAAPARQIFEHLGPAALGRVLDDLLDPGQLVQLANACGLRYPGMRTQSQSRERLVADLVGKAEKTQSARKTILRVLGKVSAGATKEWLALPAEEKSRRLGDDDFLGTAGNLGLHLYLLAGGGPAAALEGVPAESARERLLHLVGNGHKPTGDAGTRGGDDPKLRKKIRSLEKKVAHLEDQLGKARELHKSLKRDLIQRKGELAESRMLAERLRDELAELQATKRKSERANETPDAAAPPDARPALRKLAAEQKKLARNVLKLLEAPPAPAAPAPAALDPVLGAVQDLHKELTAWRRERKRQLEDQTKRLDELRAALRPPKAADGAGPTRPARRKNEAERVGIFIDVQNIYYGARKLKGKLDFDALLELSVRERRLIQTTAYVVESKANDQSQFIARLQARGIEVRRKPLQVRADGSMKGDWDMELALDILDAAPKLDVVVLVSGDGDFTSLVRRVKLMGPKVEVIGFPRNTAKSLVQAADHYEALDRKLMIAASSKISRRKGDEAGPDSPEGPDAAPADAAPAAKKAKEA